MDERYFYLGILAGALILIVGTALLNGVIGREDAANQQPETSENMTANYTIHDRQENHSRNTIHGTLRNQKQVIIHRYIPRGSEYHIYQSDDNNRDGTDCGSRCRAPRDRAVSRCGEQYSLADCRGFYKHGERCTGDCPRYRRDRDHSDTDINFYFGGDDEDTSHQRERKYYRPRYVREHKRDHERRSDKVRKKRDERNCDWWDTGYRRLARDGWHGSDEFDCWR